MSEEKQLPTPPQPLPPPPRLVQYGVAPVKPLQPAAMSGGQPAVTPDQRWETARQRQLAQSIRLLERARCLAGKSATLASAQGAVDPLQGGPAAKRPRTDAAGPAVVAVRPAPEPAATAGDATLAAAATPLGHSDREDAMDTGVAGADPVLGAADDTPADPAAADGLTQAAATGAAAASDGVPVTADDTPVASDGLTQAAAMGAAAASDGVPVTADDTPAAADGLTQAAVEGAAVASDGVPVTADDAGSVGSAGTAADQAIPDHLTAGETAPQLSTAIEAAPKPVTARATVSESSAAHLPVPDEPAATQNGSAVHPGAETSPGAGFTTTEAVSSEIEALPDIPTTGVISPKVPISEECTGSSQAESLDLSTPQSTPKCATPVVASSEAVCFGDSTSAAPAAARSAEDLSVPDEVPAESAADSPVHKLKQECLSRMPADGGGTDGAEPSNGAEGVTQVCSDGLTGDSAPTNPGEVRPVSGDVTAGTVCKVETGLERCEEHTSGDAENSGQANGRGEEDDKADTPLRKVDTSVVKEELCSRSDKALSTSSKPEVINSNCSTVKECEGSVVNAKVEPMEVEHSANVKTDSVSSVKSEPMEQELAVRAKTELSDRSEPISMENKAASSSVSAEHPGTVCEEGSPTEDSSPGDASPPETEAAPPTRDTQTSADVSTTDDSSVKKRKPGRPRKHPMPNSEEPRLSYSLLKKTGQSFLQHQFCCKIQAKLPRCRECRAVAPTRSKHPAGIFCRFTSFRRLRYTRTGQLNVSGFCDPVRDAAGADSERLWRAQLDGTSTMSLPTATFLLQHVGRQFCELVRDEEAARQGHEERQAARLNEQGEDAEERPRPVAWKRVVHGFREMCDVCETTLFNYHWVCSLCGFAVCVDCFRGRRDRTAKVWRESCVERDEYRWLLCGGKRRQHCPDKLMLTQIVAGDALTMLNQQVHEARRLAGLPACDCDCVPAGGGEGDAAARDASAARDEAVSAALTQHSQPAGSPLALLADVALSGSRLSSDDDSDSDSDGGGGGNPLRRLLVCGADATDPPKSKTTPKKERGPRSGLSWMEDTLDEVLDKVQARCAPPPTGAGTAAGICGPLRHFVRRESARRGLRERLPIRIMTLSESRRLYPSVRHSWLCDGKLLRLHDTQSEDGQRLFKDQWARGQPVLVSSIGGNLCADIWSVDAFIRDFGEIRNDLINCMTGNTVPNQPMRRFWEGFECVARRLRDERGQPMVLKLKDWPPGEDFADMMPQRFRDLMSVLPMTDYTLRDGRLNLASCLPDTFVRPDLGPKMYIAYGCALHPSKASTNLHLDVSDAVNIMVHVGIPRDGDANNEEALRAIDEAGCDQLTKRRVKDELPGALWHIYHAADADKIRDLLNKVAIERGDQLEPHHDPIHDQSWYLDGPLRRRLYDEYAVEGYPIVQCAGDAVFIPAGAPHQVRNLHSCIKVAEDFVSPENIGHCFDLTQEFRSLSDTHTNHEDKLQIKNIIYHAMKEAAGCLLGGKKEKPADAAE